MKTRLPIRDAVSAGGVVWRRTPGGDLEVVLCGRAGARLWGLPKGTPNEDESIEDTAVREVQEETGLLVERGERLSTIEYWFSGQGTRVHKRVHHWLMRPTGGDTANHDHEFDAVEWLPLDEALGRMTYANERRVVEEAARRLEAARVEAAS